MALAVKIIFILSIYLFPTSVFSSDLKSWMSQCEKGSGASFCEKAGDHFADLQLSERAVFYYKKGCQKGLKKSCEKLAEKYRVLASLNDQREMLKQQEVVNEKLDSNRLEKLNSPFEDKQNLNRRRIPLGY